MLMAGAAAAAAATNLMLYSRGLMFDTCCVPCRMAIPHFQCYPNISPDTVGILKKMSDKLEEQNPNPSWSFQPGFRGGVAEHPFNYDEQNRNMESSQPEFDNDASRQPPTPFMPHFLPRIGLPFPDFTDYHRFNGFQRNAFLGTSFGPHIPNTSFAHTFPLNGGVPGHMPVMDGFFPHPHALMHSLPPQCPIKPKPDENPDDLEKPPVLSAEYPVKQEGDMKFDSVVPKEEPMDEATAREILDKKKNDAHPFSISNHHLSMNKPFDSQRARDDIIAFNHHFYNAPLDMGVNANFKQEMSTPPLLDAHLPSDYEKFNAKRPDFPQPPLHDCQVCLSTHANGLHFGARTCAACAAFFRRTISDDKRYVCKRNQRCTNASRDGTGYRKICRSCRMKRCLEIGMLPENVQHKRNRRDSATPPRKSTFDTFFPGFYPTFPTPGAAPLPLPPTDPHHPPAN